jgi:hypothetical protein
MSAIFVVQNAEGLWKLVENQTVTIFHWDIDRVVNNTNEEFYDIIMNILKMKNEI